MTELTIFSLTFFILIFSISLMIYFLRTSPYTAQGRAFDRISWTEWFAEQIHSRLGIERESFLSRLSKLSALLIKYGVAAWSIVNFEQLSIIFWILIWVTLLVVESMRKAAQFYIPVKWENVSLKLDSEHFWLINLILIGLSEIHLGTSKPYGLMSLVGFYIVFSGESKSTILAAIEDVSSCALAIVAFMFLSNFQPQGLIVFGSFLVVTVSLRGVFRIIMGRTWIKRKFWWIAQFCLMTSLIIKSLVVLDVLATFGY
jgi:hypothetical protein